MNLFAEIEVWYINDDESEYEMTHLQRLLGYLVGISMVFGVSRPAAGDKHILFTTEGDRLNTSETKTGALRERVVQDGRAAVEILNRQVCGHGATSAWSAVYLRRLKLPYDNQCGEAALTQGITEENLLLRALCWRYLAASTEISLPKWSTVKSRDPVVRALAALAYGARGKMPSQLADALMVPDGKAVGKDRKAEVEKRTGHLGALGLAFDNGPLSLVTAFVEFREKKSVIQVGKNKRYAAWALRRLLIQSAIGKGGDTSQLRLMRGNGGGESPIAAMLDTRLATRKLETLRAMVLTGSTELKIAALRTLVTVVSSPSPEDMAVAAAALSCKDPFVRIEGARTFLMWVKQGQ